MKKQLRLTVSYVGYTDFNTVIELQKPVGDTVNIFLGIHMNDSNAVIVAAAAPVRRNGDTLEINPAAFKMRPDAVVEELLNEVPGITIWSDGTITVNGRKVQNFFVDGKPFLGVSDPRFATQNLPKTAIEKIQVYQEYDRSNIGLERQPQDYVLNMNVKLKEASKKGYFGKMGAGYGTTDRFEADLSFQVYNKRSSLAIGGGYNNINKGIGNLQDLLVNKTYRNFNPNLYNVGNFGAAGKTTGYSNNMRLSGTAGLNKQMNNSSRLVEVRDAAGALQSTNTNKSSQNSRSENGSFDFSFAKSDLYDPIKGFNFQMNIRQNDYFSQQDTRSVFNSFTDNSTDTSFVRCYQSNSQSWNLGANLNYQYCKMQKFMYYSYLAFTKNFQYPSIEQLYTIVDDINAYEIRTGNPGLKNTVSNRANFFANFNTQSPKSLYTFASSLSGGISQSENPAVDSVINDPSGKRRYYYTNAGESSNMSMGYSFNLSRKLKKNSIQLMYNGSWNRNRNPGYIDNIYNISQGNSLNHRISTQFTLSSLLVIKVGHNMQQNSTKQTAATLSSFKNSSKITQFGVTLNNVKSFTFSSTLDHIENSSLEKATILWNSFASYRFLKQQGELKLTAMDLLKQYKNISNHAGPFGTTTSITNGLQQYFMLTFSYFPRKFGKREIKRKEG